MPVKSRQRISTDYNFVRGKYECISLIPENVTQAHPLLFIHGAWHGAWCWEKHFLPFFANEGWECHAISFQGHGNSIERKHLLGTSINDYLADLEEILKAMKIKPILIGHSLGGWVIQKFLQKKKDEEIPAMILMNSIPVKGSWSTIKTFLQESKSTWESILKFNSNALLDSPEKIQRIFYSDLEENEITIQNNLKRVDKESFRFLIDTTRPIRKLVNRIPTFVMASENDYFFNPSQQKETALFYDADFFVVVNAGHNMMLSSEWKQAATAIKHWLDKFIAKRMHLQNARSQ